MVKLGVITTFDECASLTRKSDNKLLATGTMIKGLYILDTMPSAFNSDSALIADLRIWHQRLAHVSPVSIKSMSDNGVVIGVTLKPSDNNVDCVGCILGKGQLNPIPKARSSRSNQVLQLVHSDVLGPIEVPSVGGARYVITFIDDHSNWTAEYTMRQKSESL
eukprot:IDg11515t1